MLKIRCEECNGKGTWVYDNKFPKDLISCKVCNGKGYTEHEGNLEDLELGLATKYAFERKLFLAYISSQKLICTSSVTDTKKLVEMYREHKVGTQ